MKNEIFMATVFSLAVVMSKFGIDYASIFIHILIFPILLVLAFSLRQHVYWNQNRLLSIASFYYKMISYVAVLFIVFGYAGKNIFSFIAVVSVIIYLIIMLLKNNNLESLNAYLYLQIVGLFYLSFMN
jgi:hypothetical protein